MAQIELTKENSTYGNLILVNPQFPLIKLPDPMNMDSAMDGKPDIQMDEHAATLLKELLACIHCKDEITAVSGFRTQEEQESIWKNSLSENGFDFTKKFVAVPGCSEHQTGLAVDFAENKEAIEFVCPDFPRTGIFLKFRQAAPRFGFIERYPAGKEEITGIGAEPWHFRYVGWPHSIIMDRENMVLEEYILFLKENTDLEHPYIYRTVQTNIEISYIALDAGKHASIQIPDIFSYMISGTNEGGVILSLWREDHA